MNEDKQKYYRRLTVITGHAPFGAPLMRNDNFC
jgi:hypothetical protein